MSFRFRSLGRLILIEVAIALCIAALAVVIVLLPQLPTWLPDLASQYNSVQAQGITAMTATAEGVIIAQDLNTIRAIIDPLIPGWQTAVTQGQNYSASLPGIGVLEYGRDETGLFFVVVWVSFNAKVTFIYSPTGSWSVRDERKGRFISIPPTPNLPPINTTNSTSKSTTNN